MVHNALGFLVYFKVQNSRKNPRVRRISNSRFGLGFICISTVVCIFSSFREVSRAFSSCYLVPHIAGKKKVIAKNGSTRCFFGQKRMYLKTIAAESAVGRI